MIKQAWTDEKTAKLRTLWAQGISATQIGKRLGISKNSVVGRAHRIGLPGRPSPIKQGGKHADRREDYIRRKCSQVAVQGIVTAPATQDTPEQPKPSRARSEPCSWVEGKAGAWRYCDEPSEPGRVYCDDHCAVAYVKRA